MSNEAMKLALEALKNTTPTGFNMESDKKFFAAIKALEEAPKQEQGEPADVQEPDAFDDDIEVTGPTTIRTRYRLEVGTKLYTTPQQRKPLTDEQIFDLIGRYPQVMHFARAIEAAHGIKENA